MSQPVVLSRTPCVELSRRGDDCRMLRSARNLNSHNDDNVVGTKGRGRDSVRLPSARMILEARRLEQAYQETPRSGPMDRCDGPAVIWSYHPKLTNLRVLRLQR